ncbi:MAG: 50S ribosomal protein L11 methyltransferase [Defluviitaleaceae bacterium]|nr:50S ribosomal protein L11 methyltransferase [Defluviitaleaceae bacterium]
MEWIKSCVETSTLGTEYVTGLLLSCGITGVEIIDAQERARYFADSARTWDYADEALMTPDSDSAYVVFYVTKDAAGAQLLADITHKLKALAAQQDLPPIGPLTLRQESANDETWLHEWKKHFVPIRIGRVVVVPEWVDFTPAEGDVVFTIDPGTAFGTGQHQTTQLCMGALQKWVKTDDTVFDIGCGSGILSIISLLLGANKVCAIDIDPAGAIAATKKNAELNPIDLNRLTVLSGDVITDEALRQSIGGGFDVVVANIVADVIIPLAPLAGQFAKPGGLFIASGIISERLNEVLAAFAAANMTVLAQDTLEGWHCIVGRVHG